MNQEPQSKPRDPLRNRQALEGKRTGPKTADGRYRSGQRSRQTGAFGYDAKALRRYLATIVSLAEFIPKPKPRPKLRAGVEAEPIKLPKVTPAIAQPMPPMIALIMDAPPAPPKPRKTNKYIIAMQQHKA